MARVNANDYTRGDAKPSLVPDVANRADLVVGTIKEAKMNLPTQHGKAALLVFEEFPDHSFWLNKTGIQALVEKLGDDDDKWKGQKVPLNRVNVPNPQDGGKVVSKYHVAAPEDWDDIFREVKKSAAKKPARGSR